MTDPTTNSALNAISSFQNIDNAGRFRVLKEKTLLIGNPTMSWDGTNIEQAGLLKPFKIAHTFKGRPVFVRFNATNGGTNADVVDNSWHLIINATNIDLAPFISYYARVYYKE